MVFRKSSRAKGEGRISVIYISWVLLRIGLGIWIAVVVLAYCGQRRILFPASRVIGQTPAVNGYSFETINLPIHNQTTNGWFIPHDQPRGCVLFAHGNGETIANGVSVIPLFYEMGFSVLLFDYGGYGESTGSPSEQRCNADIRGMWDWLVQQKGFAPHQIVVAGRSLGGGVAMDLASKVDPGAIILISTFTSVVAVGKETLPFLPVSMLIRDRFENDRKITHIKSPILIAHSPEDEMIPFHHGERLFALAPEPKSFLRIHGGHNDGSFFSDHTYTEQIRTFLKQAIP